MNTHLLDLMSLGWEISLRSQPQSQFQVTATHTVNGRKLTVTTVLYGYLVNDPVQENQFWKRLFSMCQQKTERARGKQLGLLLI